MPRLRSRPALSALRLIAFSCAIAVFVLCGAHAARASSTVSTITSDSSWKDTYIDGKNPTDKNGTKTDVRVKVDNNGPRRALFRLPALPANVTVLQAWLRLYQIGASDDLPIDSRIHAVSESWLENEASWTQRATAVPWGTPGGVYLAPWTGRTLMSTGTNNTRVQWQIGPLLQARQMGDITPDGLIIVPDNSGKDREIVLRSTEYTGGAIFLPQVLLYTTNEPPAVARGYAEVQPLTLPPGATNAALTFALDLDAAAMSPSGAPTGVDYVSVLHNGTINVMAIEEVTVDGSVVPLSQLFWYDSGTTFALQMPKVTGHRKVVIRTRVNVLAQTIGQKFELPITADDSQTTGAWAQMLWPRDADGISGNSDSWLVTLQGSPVRIDLVPDSTNVISTLCTHFSLFGVDSSGTRFPITPDQMTVSPGSGGTADVGGNFCGGNPGRVALIAKYGTLRDTSWVNVTPALYAEIPEIRFRNLTDTVTTTLVPRDTMYLDVYASDGDGFRDVTKVDAELVFANHDKETDEPAFHGALKWQRGTPSPWTLVDPVGTSWQIVPSLCSVDTTTNSTAAQRIRFALVFGKIARASTAGDWKAVIDVTSATPAHVTRSELTSLDMRARVEIVSLDPLGQFTPADTGAVDLPLQTPASGALSLVVTANTAYQLQGAATNMTGTEASEESLYVGPPQTPLTWSLAAATLGGALGTTYTDLGAAQTAPTTEKSIPLTLYLWLDLANYLTPQGYEGVLQLRPAGLLANSTAPTLEVPLTASVVGAGLAAHSAIAEIVPHEVVAGASAPSFSAYLLPTFRISDTGIDRVVVDVPVGFGTPTVTAVRVAGLPAAFVDSSDTDLVDIRLVTALATTQLVEVAFTASAPAAADPVGVDFVVLFDDSRTPDIGQQTGTQGNANGVADGNDWHVRVVTGPLADLHVAPDTVQCFPGNVVPFTSAPTDASGNPLTVTVTWTTEGGVGTINGSTGEFIATSNGIGMVIAASGAVRDTAIVIVTPYRGITMLSVHGPASTYQGQTGLGFQALIRNPGIVPVVVDSVRLRFTKTSPGDANGTFVTAAIDEDLSELAPGASRLFSFSVDVLPVAATGAHTVGAIVGAHDTAGVAVSDVSADTVQALQVALGGIVVTATQRTAIATPGTDLGVVLDLTLDNVYPVARVLSTLTLTNATRGPGARDQLDAELGELALYRDDGDGVLEPGVDSLLFQTVALEGAVNFTPLGIAMPALGSVRFLVTERISLDVRDSDVLDLSIPTVAGLEFDAPFFARNTWPVDPNGGFTIDGMIASQIKLDPVGARNMLAGSIDNLVLRVTLPSNGYSSDRLDRFSVVDLGTARAVTDIQRMRLWFDDGDGTFSIADRPIANLVFTGNRWDVTGLSETIPTGGVRAYVTVDIADLASPGRQVRLGLPPAPDHAIGMGSGNDGPLDRAIENPFVQTITAVDRVTWSAVPMTPGAVSPGTRDFVLQHLVASSTYTDDRTLGKISFNNISVGAGSLAELDAEIERLRLRSDDDGDGELDDEATDPVIGTAFFESGRAEFTGISWTVPAGQTRHLFLVGDVSLASATDGDTLATAILNRQDIVFTVASSVVGTTPIDSKGRAAVDGLVAAQVTNLGAHAATLGPGEGPVLALDLIVPPNGYAADTLNAMDVVNLGDAGAHDLDELQLWRDGGDGAFSGSSGDDISLGTLLWSSGRWRITSLAEVVSGSGARLFVSVRVSSAPAESSTVQLGVPVGGLTFASGNDGPIDAELANTQALLLSSSPLLTSIEAVPAASTIGQSVTVRMIARNLGAEAILGITPGGLTVSGTGGVAAVSGPTPATVDLAPGTADTLEWTFTTMGAGDVSWTGSAAGTGEGSGLPRLSLASRSNMHLIFTEVDALSLTPVQSMPISVNRGQTDVMPMSLTFSNNGGAAASDARLRGLRIRLENEIGAGIVPSDLVTRVVVNEGTQVYLVKTAIENAGAEIDLTLASPLLVTRFEPTTLSLRLDLSATTAVSSFRVVIVDSTWITAEDATSGAPVVVRLENDAYPLRSGLARIVDQAVRLDVQPTGITPHSVGRGTLSTPMLDLQFGNPGVSGVSSDIRVYSIGVTVTDGSGAPLADPSMYLDAIRLATPLQPLSVQLLDTGSSSSFTMQLTPPLTIPVNTPVAVSFTADVAADATLGTVRLQLDAPSTLVALDATTVEPVPVVYAVDPIAGGDLTIQGLADTLRVLGQPMLPSVVAVGARNTAALRAVLRHPGAPGTAAIRVDSLHVTCRDEARRSLVPAQYLDGIRAIWDGSIVADMAPPASPQTMIRVPIGGLTLTAGDSAVVVIEISVAATAPAGFVELEVAASGLLAADANTQAPVWPGPDVGGELPLLSGLARLAPPARDLAVGLTDHMPTSWVADGIPVVTGVVRLTNTAVSGSGTIQLGHLVLRAGDKAHAAIPFGSGVSEAHAYVGGTLWGSTTVTPDSITATIVGDTLSITPESPLDVEIRLVPAPGGTAAAFRMGIDAACIGVIQPELGILAINVDPEAGRTFPMWTEAATSVVADLRQSYANFPNPFAAGRATTAFSYYLTTAGHVTLKIWTSRGELVTTLIDNASRPAGLHEDDVWDGRNGRGNVVTNGVYVAELLVSYDGGGSDRVLRKVAVVR